MRGGAVPAPAEEDLGTVRMGDDAVATRRCSRCHVVKPLSAFNRDRTAAAGRTTRCRRCLTLYKAEAKGPLSLPAVNRAVDGAPDLVPAVRVREELQRLRDRGYPFAVAWEVAVGNAVEGLYGNARREWLAAIEAMREVWAEAYAGIPAPPLPFVPEQEHAEIEYAA